MDLGSEKDSEERSSSETAISDVEFKAIFQHHFCIYHGTNSTPQKTNKRKTVFNAATLFQTAASLYRNAWDVILPGRLYLGMLPNKHSGHPLFPLAARALEQSPRPHSSPILADEGDEIAPASTRRHSNEDVDTIAHASGRPLGLNVAVVEPHAMGGTFIGSLLSTMTLDDYRQKNIDHLWLFIQDHTANIQNQLFIKTLMNMREAFLAGVPIHIHCKSGKGRSATLLIAFLLFMAISGDDTILNFLYDDKHRFDKNYIAIPATEKNDEPAVVFEKGYKMGEAILEVWSKKQFPIEARFDAMVRIIELFLKNKRGLVNVNSRRKAIIVKVLCDIHQSIKKHGQLTVDFGPEFNFLSAIGQTTAYKQLAMYFSSNNLHHEVSAQIVQRFLNAMIANEEGWYQELNDAIWNRGEGDFCLAALCHDKTHGSELFRLFTMLKLQIDLLLEKHPHTAHHKTLPLPNEAASSSDDAHSEEEAPKDDERQPNGVTTINGMKKH